MTDGTGLAKGTYLSNFVMRDHKSRAGLSSNALMPWIVAAVLVGLLWWAREILIPIALAVLLTFVLAPGENFLRRRGLGRTPAVILTVLCAFALLGALSTVITLQFQGLADELPNYRHNIRKKISDLRVASKEGSIGKVQETVKEVIHEINKPEPNATNAPPAVPVVVTGGQTGSAATPFLGPLIDELGSAGLVVVLVIFMLLQREDLRDRLLCLAGTRRLAITTKAVDETGKLVSTYLLRQCLLNSLFGAGLSVGLYFIGLPYAVLWGFLAAVARFIPYAGPILSAVAPVLLSLAVFDGWATSLLIIGLVIGWELVNNMIFEPVIYGQSIGASPVALLIMIAFWTWLWGPIGLVLATPLTVCLMVISKRVPNLQFISLLLGNEPPLATHDVFYHRLVAKDGEEALEIVATFLKSHSRLDFYEELLIPVLVNCRRDLKYQRITTQDQEYIFHMVRQQLQKVEDGPMSKLAGATGKSAPRRLGREVDHLERTLILGCPADDEADELALMMLAELLAAEQWEMRVLSSQILSSESLEELGKEPRAVVCVGMLSEGPPVPTRQLCRRVRSQFPQLPVVLGCWGQGQHTSQSMQETLSGVANAICYSLSEAKNHVIQFAQLQPEPPASTPQVAFDR